MSAARAALLGHFCKLASTQHSAGLTDRDLLGRFAAHRDEGAFTALVERHGGLVLHTCRAVLHSATDAEDAFQAAFLVLARRAGRIRWGESVAGWLQAVAYRVAFKARVESARRSSRPEPSARQAVDPLQEITVREAQALLHEELGRLPERLRTPLLLCFWEGATQDQAAQQLGWSLRTLQRRLAKGKDLLRARLQGRGLCLAAALSAGLVLPEPVPAVLLRTTLKESLAFAAGAPARVGVLAEAALRGAGLARAKLALVLAACAFVATAGWLGSGAREPGAGAAAPESSRIPPAAGKPAREPAARADRFGDPLPPGAVVRLGTVRYRYGGTGQAFLPDGKTVVGVQGEHGIAYWDARTGRLLRQIDTGPFSTGWNVGFSQGAKRLAVSGALIEEALPGFRPAIRIFDTTSGKEIRTFERSPREGVNGLTLSPDGKVLFGLDMKGTLRVEEVATGAERLRQQFPADVLSYLALSPDGATLALASGPNTHKLFLWKWQSAEDPRELKAPRYCGRALTFSPDGKHLAEASDDSPTVRVWDVASGRRLHRLELPDHEPYRHYRLAFTPDGKVLAASGGTNDHAAVHLWDPQTGKFLRRLEVAGSALAFSPDGTLLAAGARVWDFAAGKELSANDQAHHGAVRQVLTAGNDAVITVGEDNTIRVWEAATGRQRLKLVHGNWVRDIALSKGGSLLASNSLDDTVCLWDVATGKKIYRLPGHGRLGGRRAVGFTADGKAFLAWGDDLRLRKWDVRTGKAVAEYLTRPAGVRVPKEDDPAGREKFFDLGDGLFTPDGRHFVLQVGGRFHVFDAASGKELRHFPSEGSHVISTTISADGKLLLASAWGKSFEVKMPDGTRQSTIPRAHPVAWWDLATGRLRMKIDLPEQGAGPVAFSPDGRRFAVASSNPGTRIRIVEVATGKEVRRVEGFRGLVRSLAFLPDGRRLVAGMEDGSALIWDLTRGRGGLPESGGAQP
jgi:RNA polymerase sigma factor (sigma-70 family)